MHAVTTAEDFRQLHENHRAKLEGLLQSLHKLRLSCRFETVGRDVHVIIGTGLPPATFWADRFGVDLDLSR